MVFDHAEFDNHESVVFCHDAAMGLEAIIAIHSTALGPAAGGCRMQPYASVDDALRDVLRLSQGMSFKNAMADLPLGGGKCVIIADPNRPDKHDLLRAFSHHVQALGGRFWTAIDVGVSPEDADVLAENCDFIFGNSSRYTTGPQAAAYTALGCFTAMKAAAAHLWGSDDLAGRSVAVQGLGATGASLARLLHDAGVKLCVADLRVEGVDAVVQHYGATAVDPSKIHAQHVDVFAPCALGAVINDRTLPEIKAKLICGVANNQLAEPRHGAALEAAGITYIPDYVANAGGISSSGWVIYADRTGQQSDEQIRQKVLGLRHTVTELLRKATEQSRPTSEIADEMARSRIGAPSQTS